MSLEESVEIYINDKIKHRDNFVVSTLIKANSYKNNIK